MFIEQLVKVFSADWEVLAQEKGLTLETILNIIDEKDSPKGNLDAMHLLIQLE